VCELLQSKTAGASMVRVRRILRWVGAVVIALIIYFIVFTVGALMWQKFGGNPSDATPWMIAAATFCSVLAGTFIVSREYWKTAALAFWLLALLFPLSFLIRNSMFGHFKVLDLYELAGTVIGGFPAYYAARIAPTSTLRAKRTAAQK
jgi:cytochrome bd-type quinol oxidase subunit 2